ncbi:MAG: HPF/RaiA family ribosome-associated protein [Rhizobacter sp.]|nr:HPF/RaiA family ribosome-associated protein [Rhizobacter sp.]
MQVLFESSHPQASELRGLAERRLRFVMRRLSWRVPRAWIRLADTNGTRGGIDKQCRVELQAERGGTVVVTAVARDWRSALDIAMARATRTLVRGWQRARGLERRAGAHPSPTLIDR